MEQARGDLPPSRYVTFAGVLLAPMLSGDYQSKFIRTCGKLIVGLATSQDLVLRPNVSVIVPSESMRPEPFHCTSIAVCPGGDGDRLTESCIGNRGPDSGQD